MWIRIVSCWLSPAPPSSSHLSHRFNLMVQKKNILNIKKKIKSPKSLSPNTIVTQLHIPLQPHQHMSWQAATGHSEPPSCCRLSPSLVLSSLSFLLHAAVATISLPSLWTVTASLFNWLRFQSKQKLSLRTPFKFNLPTHFFFIQPNRYKRVQLLLHNFTIIEIQL